MKSQPLAHGYGSYKLSERCGQGTRSRAIAPIASDSIYIWPGRPYGTPRVTKFRRSKRQSLEINDRRLEINDRRLEILTTGVRDKRQAFGDRNDRRLEM